jgi:hypothetical protein
MKNNHAVLKVIAAAVLIFTAGLAAAGSNTTVK